MKKIVAILLVVTLAMCGCGTDTVADAPELINAVGVDMDKEAVKKMDLSGVVSITAQVVPKIEEISFLNSGSIDDLKVSIGDHVKKGQLLATLAGASGKAKTLKEEIKTLEETNIDTNKQTSYDIEILKQNLTDLEKQKKKAKTSSEKNKIKKMIVEKEQDIKIAEEKLSQQKQLQELEIKQKNAELSKVKNSAKNNKLISTVTGEVISTTGGSGYMVQGGNTAVQVADMEHPRLKCAYVSDSKLAKASSYVAVIDGKKYEIEAEEQEVSREDIEQGNYPKNTWFDFTDRNVKIKVGESASIELYNDSVQNALVVPTNSIFKNGEETYVYIVTGDAKTKTVVTTGTETDAYVQIVTGVKEGDVVYVEN